jgi:hypothetical protein
MKAMPALCHRRQAERPRSSPVKILLVVLVAGAAMELPLDLPLCFAWMG